LRVSLVSIAALALTGCLSGTPPPTTIVPPGTSGSGSTGSTSASSSGTGGSTGNTRVAEWNIEFFGKSDAGPIDDALQTTNVATEVAQLAPDLMAFEEVCDTTDFAQVVSTLSTQTSHPYASIVANDPSLGNAYANFGGSWGQKTALVWRTDFATLVSGQLVYRTDIDGLWGSTFAARDPLELQLQLASGGTLYVIAVHLKSEVDPASYQERVQESADLKAYLDLAHANDAVMVIGDWNDDLDGSITTGEPSPFMNFVDAGSSYRFATQPLAASHQTTLVNYTGHPIDHHMINAALFGNLIPGSAAIIQPSIQNYGRTTSDHYPTVVEYRFPYL